MRIIINNYLCIINKDLNGSYECKQLEINLDNLYNEKRENNLGGAK